VSNEKKKIHDWNETTNRNEQVTGEITQRGKKGAGGEKKG